jgi:hypothetical protein
MANTQAITRPTVPVFWFIVILLPDGEYEDGCIMSCCIVQSGKILPTFQTLAASIMKAMDSSTSQTSVNFYQTARCNNPEDSHPHPVV